MNLTLFRIIALLEGVSYILLLFVATPIKYLLHDEQYVKLLGMPHGILFMLYIIFAIVMRPEFKWESKTFNFILLAAIIPFGTFVVDKKYLRKTEIS